MKNKKTLAVIIISAVICFVVLLGVTGAVPQLDVIPDMVKVGIDYISLDRDSDAVSKKELTAEISETKDNIQHPFVLADKESFDIAREEYKNNSYTEYSEKLASSVLANADGLLNTSVYPAMEYVLDEEDSILPISREVINRMVILGYAWQVTGDEKYADRAWSELEKVCSYDDWCTSHFLATAEMALAVSIGYDWLYDYLDENQKQLLAETTWEYAIEPALSKNYLKNWFTWSKNNWNSICYSGIGIACMVFADYNMEKSAEFLAMCCKNMPIAFENFTPDGVYAEGPGYSESGMNSIVYFIATSRNYFVTDFGMSEIDGFEQLGYFSLYVSTPTGVFNYGDNKDRSFYSPVFHWYATEYDSPLLSAYQRNDIPDEFTLNTSDSVERNGSGKEDALSSLWYNREYENQNVSFNDQTLSLCLESDVGQTLALFRSEYLNENATFAGIKGGYNYTNHGDLDIGTFVFDSMGERWAEELGTGSYDAPGYFVNLPFGGRWKNYAKRAEGQNTLVINPDSSSEDQYALAECSFTYYEPTDGGGKCTLDMTDAYKMNKAKSVTRDFELYNNYSSLKITDTVKCKTSSEIYWFMHTKAEIEISEDGKTAILTINDKQMKATSHSDGVFTVLPAEALDGKYEYDADYEDIHKLTVHIENVKETEICITLEPIS